MKALPRYSSIYFLLHLYYENIGIGVGKPYMSVEILDF